MKYTVSWGENSPTKTGKNRFIADLTDEVGKTTDKVTIWGDFPNFAELAPGREVEGTIQEKQNGQYLNRTLYPEKTYNKAKWQPKGAEIAKAQEVKSQQIEKAQDNKQEAIKISSTFRDATLLTIAQLGQQADKDRYQEVWSLWREWLLDNYEVDEKTRPPFPNN